MGARPSLFAAAAVFALSAAAAAAAAADPVVVDLADRASTRTCVVTVGDVAKLAGGDEALRDRIARLDLAEVKVRDPLATVSRRAVEYRLQLAGFAPGTTVVTGADRVTVAAVRRAITAEEVAAAARAEATRRLSGPADAASVELSQPIVVKLPEIPEGERPTITAWPHDRSSVGTGRVQMDVAIFCAGEKLLSLAVYLDVRPVGAGPPAAAAPTAPGTPPVAGMPGTASPAGGPPPTPPAAGPKPAGPAEVLVRPRQRTKMVVRLGALEVAAVGEAQQEGRLGQTITLQNIDSKKMVTGRVVGPATVEVDLGGVP